MLYYYVAKERKERSSLVLVLVQPLLRIQDMKCGTYLKLIHLLLPHVFFSSANINNDSSEKKVTMKKSCEE